LYTKVDAGASADQILAPVIEEPVVAEDSKEDEIPF
jgi:hypothetical protein